MPRKKKTEETKEESIEETSEIKKEKKADETEEVKEGKKKLLEKAKQRAKQLEENIEEKVKAEDVKVADLKAEQREGKLFFSLEDYVKAGIHLGTRVISGDMRKYVYRRRADGLAILNTNLLDKKLHDAAEFISKFKADEIVVVCKREAGWIALDKLAAVTGMRIFGKKYPAGIITNSVLQDFFEPSLVIISDPWLDKNALADAKHINVPVVGLCDTNNVIGKIDQIIPCNNKSNKSLGLVFFIIAKEYCKKHGLEFNAELKDFAGEEIEDKQIQFSQ
jgi:small subunit ribosomal protein S2